MPQIARIAAKTAMASFCAALSLPAAAQDRTAPAAAAGTFFGTVRADAMAGLSYEARGCIVEVSESARRTGRAAEGQVLVRLDDQRAQLSLQTAQARVADLEAALEERDLAVASSEADASRRAKELELATSEFERNSTMLGRGLINETAMEAVERRYMEAQFAAERAQEAIATARSARKRAEIALEIGLLERETAEVTQEDLVLTAPFDGALVDFAPNTGDCVQEGARAARIYAPSEKAVDVYFLVSQLADAERTGLATGETVSVERVNGALCPGTISRIDTQADLENQLVQAVVDLDASCAPGLFLNEAVEVRTGLPDTPGN